ncbi:hypothetical protein HKD37_04G010218 [Glycine soja]
MMFFPLVVRKHSSPVTRGILLCWAETIGCNDKGKCRGCPTLSFQNTEVPLARILTGRMMFRLNEISGREKCKLIYTGSATSRAYVQSSSNPLEIFHSLCKTPFTKSEPHRGNPSLVFRNPLQQETLNLLILF